MLLLPDGVKAATLHQIIPPPSPSSASSMLAAHVTAATPPSFRVIVHIDADSFYCQVEYRRLGLPRDTPLVVQQWEGLIAVSYPARACGVRRGDRLDEARQKCPGLVAVHVETRGGEGYDETSSCGGGGGGTERGDGEGGATESLDANGGSSGDNCKSTAAPAVPAAAAASRQQQQPQQGHNRSSQKACLDRYREASEEFLAVIGRFATRVEKASIDEVYIDLTPEVMALWGKVGEEGEEEEENEENEEEEEEDGHNQQHHHPSSSSFSFTPAEVVGIAGHAANPLHPPDRALLLGARLVARIRKAIQTETFFTMSAGISHNKMLSKLASAKHKPNKQTLVPSSAVPSLLATIPIKDIRGLGGKLGEAVLALAPGCSTAAELQQFSLPFLTQHLGGKEGGWVYRVCRGEDDEEVVAKVEAKTMLSMKSFAPVGEVEGVRGWMVILAADLRGRLEREFKVNKRRATGLSLTYRGERKKDHREKWMEGMTAELTPTVSRAMVMPSGGGGGGGGGGREGGEIPVPSEAVLVQAGMALFGRVGGFGALPCTRLGLSATGFVEHSSVSIRSFFVSGCSSGGSSKKGVEEKTTTTTTAAAAADAALAGREAEITTIIDDDEEEGEAAAAAAAGGAMETKKRCHKCEEDVPSEDWQEHQDHHMALDLAYGGGGGGGGRGGGGGGGGEERGNRGSNKRSAPHGKSKKKGKEGKGTQQQHKSTPTLDKFWGTKSNGK